MNRRQMKFPEFREKRHQYWLDEDVPSSVQEVKDFLDRGYGDSLMKLAKKNTESVYTEGVSNLIHDYKIMLSNPDKYWPKSK